MSIAQFSVAEQPISQSQADAVKAKTPPKRLTVAVASPALVPEPR